MSINRRELLARAGLGTLAAGLWGPSPRASADILPRPAREEPTGAAPSWEWVRDQFLLDPSRTHLAMLLLASHPRPVREAIERHRGGLDENPAEYIDKHWLEREAAVTARAALHLGVPAGEVALTDSTTMGLALLYTGIRVKRGQEILTTTHDHYSTHESLRLRAVRTGARFRKVPLYRDPATASAAEIVQNLTRALRRRTRVVAATWVHSGTGVKLPIAEMAEVIRAANRHRSAADRILFCVDGVHGFGAENVTMAELGCDFFVAGCHKWLFGPRGTGLIWGRADVATQVDATIPTFTSWDGKNWGGVMSPGGFHSFEHRWALAEAFEFHLRIGKARIHDRIHELTRRLKEGLKTVPGLKLHTPMDDALSAGIVCFEMERAKPKEIVERLASRKIVASTTPYATSYARFTPGVLNTVDDIDRAVEALRNV